MSRQHSWHAHLRRFAFTSLLLLGVATSAFAQFDRGTITGTVKDAQGGIVPGVTVTLTSTQTQQVRSTVTDGSGFYTFPNLTAGRYEISAELSGFKKTSRSNVQLDAAGALSLDFTLETGALTEEVTVTAETTALQTQVAVRKSVEAKDIELLSFSGRNPIGVPALKAGVIGGNFNNAGFSSLTNGGFNVNGGRSDENNITIDGAVAIRTRSAGATIGVQNVDAVQEVQVLTANYMPEYGRASAGQIRFVTKSGSNRYTGNASYFYPRRVAAGQYLVAQQEPERHRELRRRALRLQAVRLLLRRPDSRARCSRTSCSSSARRNGSTTTPVQTNQATVPTEAMRRGDFSQLLGSNPFYSSPQIIRDPLTGAAVPQQRHPDEPAVANGIGIMNLYPTPTAGLPVGLAELRSSTATTRRISGRTTSASTTG